MFETDAMSQKRGSDLSSAEDVSDEYSSRGDNLMFIIFDLHLCSWHFIDNMKIKERKEEKREVNIYA